MASLTLDWSKLDIDGSNMLSIGDETLGIAISTPQNADCDQWTVASVGGETGVLRGADVSKPVSVHVGFDRAVENLRFELLDVDAGYWDDQITIIALDAAGNQVPVSFSDLAFHHTVSGQDDNVLGSNGNVSPGVEGSGAPDSVTVHIAGPIVSLELIYDNGPDASVSGIVGVSDIAFDMADDDLSADGYVEGTGGADVIDSGYRGDPDGDRIDNGDAVLPGQGPDDDIVLAGAGDDIVRAGAGDDTIFGGAGADQLYGGSGADIIYGDTPTNDGPLDFNTLTAGELVADQFIDRGVRITSADPDHPVMVFDSAHPTGGDFDLETPNNGNILILSEDGDSSDPDDNVGGGTFIFDFTAPATVNSLDFIDMDNGTVIRLYDADGNLLNTIPVPAGSENEVITQPINTAGVTRMEVELLSSGAIDNLDFTLVNDADSNNDTIHGGSGNDIIFGQQGDDTIRGGRGEDTITGGAGADHLSGGDGSDLFLGGTAGDVVIGGEDDDDKDIDVLDLTGSNVDFITYDEPGGESGTVTFRDGTTMTFSEIENVIPCFTPGTRIATPRGERLVETLRIGDRVLTRDNGIQHVVWAGQKTMSADDLNLSPGLRPVLIRAGALGNGLPERNMLVSPNHRVLVVSEMAQLYFEESEVLIAAKHMTKMKGVTTVKVPKTTYIHFMCERHEVVLSDGAWTETFQPGDYSLQGVDHEQRKELFNLFPELATKEGLRQYRSARKALKRHESTLLLK